MKRSYRFNFITFHPSALINVNHTLPQSQRPARSVVITAVQ